MSETPEARSLFLFRRHQKRAKAPDSANSSDSGVMKVFVTLIGIPGYQVVVSEKSSRPISILRISLVPAPIS